MSYIKGNLHTPCSPSLVKKYVLLLLLLIIAPVTVSAANYLLGDRRGNGKQRTVRALGFYLKHRNIPRRSFGCLLHRRYAGAAFSRFTPGLSSRSPALRAIAATTTQPGVSLFASMDLRRTGGGLARYQKP